MTNAVRHVVFRTDATSTMGSGHVMRSLTLATALRGANVISRFVCRAHDGHLNALIEQRGFQVERLAAPTPDFHTASPQAEWLGASGERDAEETLAALARGPRPDWLVIDHYGIDKRWEGMLRPAVDRVMVIDDLADRDHDCDLLLDQNLIHDFESRYRARVPARCGQMLGPAFALVEPAYRALHDRLPPREGPLRRILVSFGGADTANMTGRTLAAFLSIGRPDIEIDVVLAGSGSNEPAIRRLAEGHANVHLHARQPSLAALMARADLAMGAGGSSSWERLCVGLPAIIVSIADNQKAIADGLHRRGLAKWLGHFDEVSDADLAAAIRALAETGIDRAWSVRCMEAVDGRGVGRVVAALTVQRSTFLAARPATRSDDSMIARTGLYGVGELSADLRELENRRVYIVETGDGDSVGAVRMERGQSEWRAAFALEPHLRERGLARRVMATALAALRTETREALGVQLSSDDLARLDAPTRATKPLRIGIASAKDSWINEPLAVFVTELIAMGHDVAWAHDARDLPGGDICCFLSYTRIVDEKQLARYKNNVVVHASDLPRGRGWSPMTWLVLEGADRIPVSLIEALPDVDSGPIYAQEHLALRGDELVTELRDQLTEATFRLCRRFVAEYPDIVKRGRPQEGEATFYRRRTPADSMLAVDAPLAEQLDLLRVADNDRYPAWFELRGRIVRVRLDADPPIT